MIKVGQIFKDTLTDEILCIVKVDNSRGDCYFNAIYNNGFITTRYTYWLKEFCELIAEYPTWQEAVNSPEFRGEK